MLQWSNFTVWASMRVDPLGIVPSRPNARWFESIMHAASTSRFTSARAASRSPPTWSPCKPTPTSKRRTWKSRPGLQPCRANMRQRQQRRLGRVDGANPNGFAAQIGQRLDRALGADDDHRGQIAIGVPHGQGRDLGAARSSEAAGANPGQRRIPGDMDPPVEQFLHLPLVVGIQHVVEREPLADEPLAKAGPDRDDFRGRTRRPRAPTSRR